MTREEQQTVNEIIRDSALLANEAAVLLLELPQPIRDDLSEAFILLQHTADELKAYQPE